MLAALKAFGRRNIVYLVFTGLMFPFAIWLESTGKSQGPDRGAGYMLAIILWLVASLASFGVNAVLFFVGLSHERPVIKEIIGVALPFVVVALALGLERACSPDQRPWNAGLRFSMKARRPSL